MEIRDLLKEAVLKDASDLHICSGIPPVMRVHGELTYMGETKVTETLCEILGKQFMSLDSYDVLKEHGEVDLSLSIPEVGRFRVNAFKQRNSFAYAFRTINQKIPTIEELGLPESMVEFTQKQRGLVLVTGPTGSGKSSTLASLIGEINRTRSCHIVTIEDPIEYLHQHQLSVINQREVGRDTESFANALRAVLREDPDVILVGEMRDKETIETALTAAETGHLVFSTLHTLGAAKTLDRIIDVFPPHQQNQVRSQLSTSIQGIISQQLMRTADGKGRVVATELMKWTPAIANLIREGRTPQINSNIHTGIQHGMYSMDSSLAALYKTKKIDYETAIRYAIDADNLKKLISEQLSCF